MTTEIRTLSFSAPGLVSVVSNPITCTTDGLGAARAIGGLEFLLDAIDGMTGNGVNLTSFVDVSGNDRVCTIGTAPLMTPTTWSGGGGKPGLRFNRASSHYIKVNLPSIPQPFTLFSVIDLYTSGDPAGSNANLINPGFGISYRIAASDRWSMYAGTPVQTTIVSSASLGKYIRFDVFDGAASKSYRSGTASAAVNPGSNGTIAGEVGIGARNDGVDATTVILPAAGLYSKALSLVNMATLLALYTARYPGINP